MAITCLKRVRIQSKAEEYCEEEFPAVQQAIRHHFWPLYIRLHMQSLRGNKVRLGTTLIACSLTFYLCLKTSAKQQKHKSDLLDLFHTPILQKYTFLY